MKYKIFLPLFAFIMAFVLVACGGGDGDSDSGDTTSNDSMETMTVVMNDIYFGDSNDNATNPPTWTVTNGAKVQANFENNGALEHNWAVIKQGVELPDTITDPDEILFDIAIDGGSVNYGESTTFEFTAPAAGEYLVICTVAGHYPAMQGKLIVQ